MTEPAYVRIAGEYARRIRSGALPPGARLPSYAEIAEQNGVSDIVVRGALDLLQSQGLVRSVRRKGVFVADRPGLIRVSPERQMESAEQSFRNESNRRVQVDREATRIPATNELAQVFDVPVGQEINKVVTRAAEDGRPISISDTYHPVHVTDISDAAFLEEKLSDELPSEEHAEWLRVTPGELVKTVYQRFLSKDDRVIMLSHVSYPRDRYDAFVFRMALK